MKINKLLLLLTLITFNLSTSNAQNASNDATWDETISFINRNIQFTYLTGYTVSKSLIVGNNLIINFSRNDGYGTVWLNNYILPIDKIKTAEGSGDTLVLLLQGKYVKNERFEVKKKYATLNDSDIYLFFDKKLNPRMVKAFQHIGYLNTERNKKSKF